MSQADLQAGGAFVRLFLKDEVTRQLKKTMEKAGKTMVIAGAAMAAPFAYAVAQASRMEETMSKFGVVFGGQSSSVKAWGDELAKQIGRSRQEIASFLAETQDLFVPLGFAASVATDLSKQVTQLTYDLASFNNKADADVMRDLQAALTGSGEVMKKYGVILNETAVKQELLNMGMDPRAANDQAKVQARLNIIMRGTTAAQGDAERTGGSFANQMKALKATVSDVAVEIGTALLPHVTSFVAKAKAWGSVVSALVSQNKQLFVVLGSLPVAVIAVGTTLLVLAKTITVVSGAMAVMTAHPIVAGLVAVAAAIALINVALMASRQAAQEKINALRQLSKEAAQQYDEGQKMRAVDIDRMKRLEQLAERQRRFGHLTTSQTEEAIDLVSQLDGRHEGLGITVDKNTGKIEGLAGAMDGLVASMEKMADLELENQMRAVQRELASARDRLAEFVGKYEGLDDWQADWEAVNAETKEHEQAVSELEKQWDKLLKLRTGGGAPLASKGAGEGDSGGPVTSDALYKHHEDMQKRLHEAEIASIDDLEKRERVAAAHQYEQDKKSIIAAFDDEKDVSLALAQLEKVREQEFANIREKHRKQREAEEHRADEEKFGRIKRQEEYKDRKREQDEQLERRQREDIARAGEDFADRIARQQIEIETRDDPEARRKKLIEYEHQLEMKRIAAKEGITDQEKQNLESQARTLRDLQLAGVAEAKTEQSTSRQMGNLAGMYSAAAIAAAGRGASPEQKSLEELRQIRKEAREQRIATNRLALATERRNLAMTHP